MHTELDHALQFLHKKTGLVCYFPESGLTEYVFRDPQVLFDQVTQLITNTFTFENVQERRCTRFKNKGIFSLEDLKLISEKLKHTLPSEKLIKLLEHLRIVASFSIPGEENLTYFIPCVLVHSEMCTSQHLSKSLYYIPPLLVTFKCGYCPKGLSGALIVYLLTNEMKSKFKWKLQTEKIFRDQV